MHAEATPSKIWCKICGITTAEDARMAQQAGADALGLVFYPASRRAISLADAAVVARSIRVAKVGLFVDPEKVEVDAAIAACNLDFLQFNGTESVSFCEQFDLPYLKALHVGKPGQTQADISNAIDAFRSAWAILLDTFVDGQFGGTGVSFERDLWPGGSDARLVIAGGLSPASVAQALADIRKLNPAHPFGVDVSGGVERRVDGLQEYGRKDPVLVEKFISEAKHVG